MRGKLLMLCALRLRPGITPADAGKTTPTHSALNASPDHPRGCGENATGDSVIVPSEGSPPRMRGKLRLWSSALPARRITPADAGKTLPDGKPICRQPDHPRGCGENRSAHTLSMLPSGSPPRMRGKPVGGLDLETCRRITPADAGKTALVKRSRCGA